MDELLYFPVFLAVVSALAAMMAWQMYSSPGSMLSDKGKTGNIWLCLPLCLVLTLWLGNRPVDGTAFGDTFSYAHMYNNVPLTIALGNLNGEWLFSFIIVYCRVLGLDVHQFFTVIEAFYVLSALWAVRRLMPKNPLLGMVFMCGSLMFFTFGVNGIRNGMACHLVLLGMSFLLSSNYIAAAILAIAGFFIHRSVALPIASIIAARWIVKEPRHGLSIWIASIFLSLLGGSVFINLFASLGFDDRMESYGIENSAGQFGFSSTGFRWDFLLYSSVPVILGYVVLIKKNLRENWYRVLYNTYCLANAFWILIIRTSFSNRFAYLSWFMYPVIIAYPLTMMHLWEDQDRKTAQILLAYVGFTLIMDFLYW